MDALEDPFRPLPDLDETAGSADDFASLARRPSAVSLASSSAQPTAPPFDTGAPALGRLHGFDVLEQPVVANLAALPGEVVQARSTVPLRRAHIGHDVLVMFVGGDAHQPVIVGVIEPRPLQDDAPVLETQMPSSTVSVRVDGERRVIEAESEVVLRCGDASITLTRAGKVIIKGNYILSRSTGHNKIKGAAIDIN
ncbi:MAG TPA: DUF6484 domain-containing protein [Burkholderiaceae bacterium]|nr:DUF6484 domain-containing protein [Burkholderiaceae bacterium]